MIRASRIAFVVVFVTIAFVGFGARFASAGESAEALWPLTGIRKVSVSPSGAWIAAEARRGEESMVLVQRVGLAKLASLVSAEEVGAIAWDGPDTLIVEALTPAGLLTHHFFRLSLQGDAIASKHSRIHAIGTLLDALPLRPEEVLWLFPGRKVSAHRVTVADLVDYQKVHRWQAGIVDIGETVGVVAGNSSNWVAQRDGTPRAALRHGEGFTALMMSGSIGTELRTVYRWDDDEDQRQVIPVGLTPDEESLLVLAYKGADTLGLYEWDERSKDVGKEVFVHPDYDLVGLINDPITGDLVAVFYEEDGERRFHYFEAYRARYLERLPESWRTDSVAVLNGSADRQVLVLIESSSTNPGDYHVRDRSGRVLRIGRWGENVDRSRRSPVEAFRVKSGDDLEIEAFLTLPRSAGKVPLVVMPHGGPHRVQDNRDYDPMNQYLASWGFAVLQVNYRGSGGRGLEFEVSGKKEWGRGIEDDIDAAVEHAMKLPSIDPNRICIVGGSYGGFSAFASVIRHRDRYRCAVSINGVSDVPLLYDSSDMADREDSMAFYEEYVGDPETEREKLLEISPAYHVAEISVPTLIIQGAKDRRVDPDHAHRMALMFELHGKPHELLEIEDAEHAPDRDQWIIIARTLRRFLTERLTPEIAFEWDPSTRWD